eukprot:s4849_g4.t1
MVFVNRGSDKAAFEAEGLILKLSLQSQIPELRFSGWLPQVVARTFWQERVLLRLHRPMDGVVLHTHELFLTCQEKTLLATELFSQRGEHWTFKFLAYVGCLLTYVASMGIVAKDTGATNLGVKLGTASAANPQALFFDTMSWTRVKPPAKPSCKWSGWFECAKSWCPFHARWLRDAASTASSNPSGTFRRLFSECQSILLHEHRDIETGARRQSLLSFIGEQGATAPDPQGGLRNLDSFCVGASMFEYLFEDTLQLQIDMGVRVGQGLTIEWFQIFLQKVIARLGKQFVPVLFQLLDE